MFTADNVHKKQSRIQIMGVLNITPDSFSDGDIYYKNIGKAVARVKEMLEEGADIIDVGGESTKPGSRAISAEEELERVLPVIESIREKLGKDFPLSVDTYKTHVAKEALQKGANIINSLSGFDFDKSLVDVVREFTCPIVIYHIKGTPKTMQKGEIHYDDVIEEITQFFNRQIAFGVKNGLKKDQFIIDPGIGFGKTKEQNLEIIRKLSDFKKLKLPILIGISRKSHLATILKDKLKLKVLPLPQERLEACLAETAVAVLNGAQIVRTHDILQTKRFVTVIEAIQNI